MSGNRWRVDRVHHVWPEPHHAWQVTETLARGVFDYHGPFPTHTEAIAYADEMAHTVTITLPRVGRQSQIPVPEDYRNERPISVSNHGDFIGATFTAQGLKQDVAIHPDELEPLALTLLAMHHQRKEQQ